MKILSITAQKPTGTGSGFFLTELVRALDGCGHQQMVVGGVYPEDEIALPDGVPFRPVFFCQTPSLAGAAIPDAVTPDAVIPYPIVGMSDEMPYKSTRYRDMTPAMVSQFERAFMAVIRRAVEDFDPDVIFCHHLYLLTAMVREAFPDRRVCGFCHNTDLRQMKKHALEKERIRRGIASLDRIFVLRRDQIAEVEAIYGADPDRMTPVGMGYNSAVFNRQPALRDMNGRSSHATRSSHTSVRLIFAGKISEKKGVMSLIRSLSYLPEFSGNTGSPSGSGVTLTCAGGAGNEDEYREILSLAEKAPCPVTFTGRLDQTALAALYNQSDIFVLPSFSEGLPLTVIEALACGCRVVVSDLPGVRDWLDEFVRGGDIRYVTLPALVNTDEAVPEELPAFERRLAEAIADSIRADSSCADVSALTWERLASLVLETLR